MPKKRKGQEEVGQMPKKKKKREESGQKAVNSSKPPPGEIRKLALAKGQSWPQVSSLGRFKNIFGVISTPKPKKQGGEVSVHIAGHDYSVGAMMLRASRGLAPTSKHMALHWNLDRTDNRIENLKWATRKEIKAHSRKMNPNHKSPASQQCKPIRGRKVKVKVAVAKGEEDEDDEVQPPWKTYKLGARQAANELGLAYTTIIYAIRRPNYVTRSGYEFEYVKDELGEGEEFMKIPIGDGPYELPIDVLGKIKNSKRKGDLCHPEISNLGRFKDTSGIIKTPLPDKEGYCRVQIMGKDGIGIHGLVCSAFLGQPPADMVDPTPDHIDRCRSNNRVENLRWATKREQILNRDPDRESNGPRQSKPLKGRKIRVGGDGGEEEEREWVPYGSLQEAVDRIEKLDGVVLQSGSISQCCHGKQNQTCGYEFKYDEEAAEPRVLPGEIWWDIIQID